MDAEASDMPVLVPDLLTVMEAAGMLRVGRTTAYDLVGEYFATDGASGLPCAASVASYGFRGCCSKSGSASDSRCGRPSKNPTSTMSQLSSRSRSYPAHLPSSFEVFSAVTASVQRVGPPMEHTFWFDSRGSNDRQVPTGSWELSC